MIYYVRSINEGFWNNFDYDVWDAPADIYSKCLKSDNGKISIWKIENKNLSNIHKVVVALVSSYKKKITNGISIIVFPEADINDSSLNISETFTESKTKFKEMLESHYDILKMDFRSLKEITEIIIKNYNLDMSFHKFDIDEVLTLLKIEYNKQNTLMDLNQDLKEQIEHYEINEKVKDFLFND